MVAALVLRLTWVVGEVARRRGPGGREARARPPGAGAGTGRTRRAMISVVIPLYNEAESLPTLHAELDRVFAEPGVGPVEFVFVDDGSRDGSWAVVCAAGGPTIRRVRAIRFRRNFGKAAALTAGFQAARGEIVFTLDGDLQDDPAEIPRFLRSAGRRARRRQRLEADPARPLAQGLPQPRLQLAGQQADRLPAPRPQLRLQGLPPRGARRGRHLRRAAPVRPGPGAAPRGSASARSRSTTGRGGSGRRSTASPGSSRGCST